jgi:hypothetical protein
MIKELSFFTAYSQKLLSGHPRDTDGFFTQRGAYFNYFQESAQQNLTFFSFKMVNTTYFFVSVI